MYDEIVVGARCAGSATAMLLARKGHKVLLVDKASFPSDTMSTHFIWQPGVANLKKWGLLDAVRDSNCPPVTRMKFDVGPLALFGSPPAADGTTEALAPRRQVLDKILVDAAEAAGAEVREGFSVNEVVIDDGRVTGVKGSGSSGAVEESARMVIGADGKHSTVAKAVRAPVYNERPILMFAYFSYWSGVNLEELELYPRDQCAALAFPTNDGLVGVIAAGAIAGFSEFRTDIEGNFFKTLDQAPDLASRVREGKREERFQGTADLSNFFRKPFGPGWALVGDAGYNKDPTTAQGISDAFRDAELLSEAIDEGFSGRQPLEEALAGYEGQRNEASMPMYEFTCQVAALQPPPPEMRQLLGALAGNQAETDQFLGVIAGTTPIPQFFAPENMARIIGAGAGAAADA